MTTEAQETIKLFPYSHSFYRYFEVAGTTHDRLELILRHGLLSPKQAEAEGVPYIKLPILAIGLGDYEDLIFLYSREQRQGFPVPGDVTLLFDQALPIITPSQMQEAVAPSFWPTLSPGEVYVKRMISPDLVRGIRLRQGTDVNKVQQMVEEFIPEPRNIRVTTL
ncbi:MAG: hypothetical protein HYU48_02015 [Candidatus Levybacteria bacterium]|nr:hypothetical protein [Candidatus Levybacteria bacterium]